MTDSMTFALVAFLATIPSLVCVVASKRHEAAGRRPTALKWAWAAAVSATLVSFPFFLNPFVALAILGWLIVGLVRTFSAEEDPTYAELVGAPDPRGRKLRWLRGGAIVLVVMMDAWLAYLLLHSNRST